MHQDLPVADSKTNEIITTIIGRLHFDFESRSLYVSIYIPHTDRVDGLALLALSNLNNILNFKNGVYVQSSSPGDDPTDTNDLIFTGRIFIYDENEMSEKDREHLFNQAKAKNHAVKIRGQKYANERSKLEKPLAFISHDSRDKDLIANPLAVQLQKMLCPVWYDEFSLKVGDSLRESIENGLKESKKCILVLTKNFLSNNGWGRREYDSIFTRELIENQKVILPVWYDITPEEIYQYSPILADRVGINWSLGAEEVAKKLYHAINA